MEKSNFIRRSLQAGAIAVLLLGVGACGPHYVAQVPEAQVEVVPAAPYTGAVWIGGGWAWRGGRHVWVPGYYSRPRPGRVYVGGEWRHSPRGHYYVRGGWRR